jgi:hypothetical protein
MLEIQMNIDDYNDEELELLDAIENQPLVSVINLAQEIDKLKTAVEQDRIKNVEDGSSQIS